MKNILAIIFLLLLSGILFGQEITSGDCLSCHADSTLQKESEGKTISLFVDEKKFQSSVHGSLECMDCHSDIKEVPHEADLQKVSCGACHAEEQSLYDDGLHAKAVSKGPSSAARCLDCHGDNHQILSAEDPNSPVHHSKIPKTCGACHGVKFVMEKTGVSAQPFFSYQQSVHGQAVQAGSAKAAVCTDCHASHDIRSAADAKSSIFKFNVPDTCGKCHGAVEQEFNKSIHGQSLIRGNGQAPACTDCHGIHLIKPHIDPTSSVANQALARTTCAHCHEGVKLSEEFGVASKRMTTYMDSYHGLASKLGSNVVANCASCHGIHNILPSTDPDSMIHKANLTETCGKCHPGAGDNFSLGKIHVDVPVTEDFGSIVTYWIRYVYIWLIVIIIGAMFLHNAIIWWKKAVRHRMAQDRSIVRLPRPRRIQHLILLITFILLALTGFALKYPDSWLAWLLGSNETLRRLGHRIAAVIFLIGGTYHFLYVVLTKEGRRFLNKMRPVLQDLFDSVHYLFYYLGWRSTKPKFNEFNYAEKAEYWAFIWGIFIMGLTGLMIWFKVTTTSILPRWIVDAAIAVHFYEAVLASLAILVWHFYHVILDPDVYPMNWAWWDGRVSPEHFEHEHPIAYQELMARRGTPDSGNNPGS